MVSYIYKLNPVFTQSNWFFLCLSFKIIKFLFAFKFKNFGAHIQIKSIQKLQKYFKIDSHDSLKSNILQANKKCKFLVQNSTKLSYYIIKLFIQILVVYEVNASESVNKYTS